MKSTLIVWEFLDCNGLWTFCNLDCTGLWQDLVDCMGISTDYSSAIDFAFSHHYQGRIDFNTDNLFHSAGMDFVCIPASRIGLTNPLPRAKIDQSSPCRGLSTHPRAMNTQ